MANRKVEVRHLAASPRDHEKCPEIPLQRLNRDPRTPSRSTTRLQPEHEFDRRLEAFKTGLSLVRALVVLLALMIAALSPALAGQKRDAISLDGRLCHLALDEPRTMTGLLMEPNAFVCSPEQRQSRDYYNWLRADGLSVLSSAQEPWFLRFRNTLMHRVNVAFRYADQHVEIFSAAGDDLSAFVTGGNMIAFRVPARVSPLESVLVGVEGHPGTRAIMRSPGFVSAARLRADAAQNNFLFGGLIGLLLAAVAFNVGFYGALRARFQLEMVGASTAFLVYLTIWSGALEQAGLNTALEWRVGGGLVLLAFTAYALVRFSLSFLERTSIWRPAAQTALAAAVAAVIASFGVPTGSGATIAFFDAAFHAFVGVTLLALLVIFGVALWRGSPAARFLLVGMAPVVAGAMLRTAYALNLLPSTNFGESAMFVGATVMTVVMCYAVARRVKEIQRAHEEARQRHGELTLRAERDGLTGLLNRRTFIEQVELRLNFDVGDRLPVFLILDLDHFKQVNDTFGHEAGDKVLKHAAEILARTCRTGDIVGRLGGEEFGVLIVVREEKEAAVAAERIRAAISTALIHRIVPGLTHMSASIGVAVASEKIASWSELYQRADQALYGAKAEGRNRVCMAPAAADPADVALAA
jgi:diguanylate cyclase (GGDEF)-like protein